MQECKSTLKSPFILFQSRKEKESELLRQIDERAFSLTLELAKSKKSREETEEKYTNELNDLLDRVEA